MQESENQTKRQITLFSPSSNVPHQTVVLIDEMFTTKAMTNQNQISENPKKRFISQVNSYLNSKE